MKIKFKKILGIVLSMAIVLSLVLSVPNVSAKTYSGHNDAVKWTLKNGELTISRYPSSGKVKIPDYSTTKQPDWCKHASEIKSVTIKDNITKIGSYAFWGLTKATKITIGKDVTDITGTAPFGHCDSLTSFSVASANTAFKVSSGILYNYGKTSLIAYPANKKGTTFTVPDSVTNIKGFSFSYSQNLTKITHNTPGSIKTINGGAFYYAKKLETVTVKNNCETLGNRAFYGCTTLKSVTLPPSITSVGTDLFLAPAKVKNLRIYCSPGSTIYQKLTGKGYILTTQKWTFTCTFDTNGGSISEKSKTVTFNEKYGTLPTPEKEGYTFSNWKLDNKVITSSTTVSTPKSHTLKASYSADKIVVNCDACGGICDTSEITVNYGEPFGTLPTPTRAGYTFTGWYTTPNGAKNPNENEGDVNDSEDEEYNDDEYSEDEDYEDNEYDSEKSVPFNKRIYSNTIYDNTAITTIYAHWNVVVEQVKGIKISYYSPQKVKLSWSSQKEVGGYQIYTSTNGKSFKLTSTVSENSKVISLNSKNSYKFKVRAYSNDGNGSISYGNYSDVVSRAKTYISKPKVKVKYKKSTKILTIKWSGTSGVKYKVYQRKNKKWKKLKLSTNATGFTARVKSKKTYKFRIRGYKKVLGHTYYSKYKNFSKKC